MILTKNADRLISEANRQLQLTAQGKGFDSGVTAEKANDQNTSFTDVILHQGQQYLAKMTSLYAPALESVYSQIATLTAEGKATKEAHTKLIRSKEQELSQLDERRKEAVQDKKNTIRQYEKRNVRLEGENSKLETHPQFKPIKPILTAWKKNLGKIVIIGIDCLALSPLIDILLKDSLLMRIPLVLVITLVVVMVASFTARCMKLGFQYKSDILMTGIGNITVGAIFLGFSFGRSATNGAGFLPEYFPAEYFYLALATCTYLVTLFLEYAIATNVLSEKYFANLLTISQNEKRIRYLRENIEVHTPKRFNVYKKNIRDNFIEREATITKQQQKIKTNITVAQKQYNILLEEAIKQSDTMIKTIRANIAYCRAEHDFFAPNTEQQNEKQEIENIAIENPFASYTFYDTEHGDNEILQKTGKRDNGQSQKGFRIKTKPILFGCFLLALASFIFTGCSHFVPEDYSRKTNYLHIIDITEDINLADKLPTAEEILKEFGTPIDRNSPHQGTYTISLLDGSTGIEHQSLTLFPPSKSWWAEEGLYFEKIEKFKTEVETLNRSLLAKPKGNENSRLYESIMALLKKVEQDTSSRMTKVIIDSDLLENHRSFSFYKRYAHQPEKMNTSQEYEAIKKFVLENSQSVDLSDRICSIHLVHKPKKNEALTSEAKRLFQKLFEELTGATVFII